MKNKTFFLTMLFILCIIGILGFYLYSMSTDKPISISISDIIGKDKEEEKEDNKKKEKNKEKDEEQESTSRSLEKVNDYQEYFNIDAVINEYYSHLTHSEGKELLSILDENYKKVHKITKKNISNYYEKQYQDISFYTKEVYVKGKNNVDYYFVKGDTQLYNFFDEEITEGNDVFFMVTVDNNNSTYSIHPLDNVTTTYAYAQKYNMPKNKEIEDTDYNTFIEKEYSDQIIGEYYINYYRSIVYMNTEKAYEMLGASSKEKYYDLETFTNDLENIYNNILNKKYTGFNASGNPGSRIYQFNDGVSYTITITEDSVMNFTIDF